MFEIRTKCPKCPLLATETIYHTNKIETKFRNVRKWESNITKIETTCHCGHSNIKLYDLKEKE